MKERFPFTAEERRDADNYIEQTTEENEDTESCNSKNRKLLLLRSGFLCALCALCGLFKPFDCGDCSLPSGPPQFRILPVPTTHTDD